MWRFFLKSYLFFYVYILKITWTLHHPTDVNRKHVEIHIIKSKFVLSLILYKTASIFKNIDWLQRYHCCCASRVWKDCYSIRYRENSSLVGYGDCHTCSCNTSNLYKTEPGATFVWLDMQIFQNFHPNPSFFSSNPLLNKSMIRACCICWSRDCKWHVLSSKSCS